MKPSEVRIMMPVKSVPAGTRVFRPTGETEYIVRDEYQLIVRHNDTTRVDVARKLAAEPGTRFLVPVNNNGSIYAISEDRAIAVSCEDINAAWSFLDEMINSLEEQNAK